MQNDLAVLVVDAGQNFYKKVINTDLDKYGYNKNKNQKQELQIFNAEYQLQYDPSSKERR